MDLSKEKKELLEKVLEGNIPQNNHVLIVAEDAKYQSPNGVISNLEKGGSTGNGVIIRIGNQTRHKIYSTSTEKVRSLLPKIYRPKLWQTVMFMKYEATEIIKDVYLLDIEKIKMYKNE